MKKLIPPVLFLLFVILMALVCQALGSPHTLTYPASLTGAALVVAGLGISIYHSNLFKKSGANIMTFGEPTHFVRSGMYRYSRNPMYLGFVVALLGTAFVITVTRHRDG